MGPSRDRMADWKEEQEAAEKEGVVWLEPRKRKRSRGSRGRCGGGEVLSCISPPEALYPHISEGNKGRLGETGIC